MAAWTIRAEGIPESGVPRGPVLAVLHTKTGDGLTAKQLRSDLAGWLGAAGILPSLGWQYQSGDGDVDWFVVDFQHPRAGIIGLVFMRVRPSQARKDVPQLRVG